MKSISITRLKQDWGEFNDKWTWDTWNEKHLDYEIETWKLVILEFRIWFLEMKSISITRLKQIYHSQY